MFMVREFRSRSGLQFSSFFLEYGSGSRHRDVLHVKYNILDKIRERKGSESDHSTRSQDTL